ncbi:MAG: IS1595 family transposase [Pyrinomonadaceae bacterium]|jgi:transposase-like protein|nr:IS1595 family transposase [Pyrinomonadaceae bacterium]
MTSSYKIYIRTRISRAKFRQILRLFALDLTASQIAVLSNLNRNTINRYLTLIRSLIADFCEQESPFFGKVELDESYFGSRHRKGKRGRGAENKHIVFGIYKRNGKVFTEIVQNVKAKTLQAIIKGKVDFSSTIYTDGFKAYNSIVHIGYQKHYRIFHQDNYALGDVHINGIEGFWGYAKVRLVKYRGISKNTFYLHLKECEFRFNYRQQNLYQMLLKLTKKIVFC